MKSFLMVGQSNMAGRGFLSDVEPIREKGLFSLRGGRFFPLWEPVNYDRPFAGVGLMPMFAKLYKADNPEESVGLIPCADGGTKLEQWKIDDVLFDYAIACAKIAQKNSEIEAIVWHQGESDSKGENAQNYKERFLVMMEEMKKRLGLESVPVIVGGLGDYLAPQEAYADYHVINKQMQELARENRGYYYVSAKGLTCNPDNLHFNAVSIRKFGERYYKVFKEKRSLFDEDVEE